MRWRRESEKWSDFIRLLGCAYLACMYDELGVISLGWLFEGRLIWWESSNNNIRILLIHALYIREHLFGTIACKTSCVLLPRCSGSNCSVAFGNMC